MALQGFSYWTLWGDKIFLHNQSDTPIHLSNKKKNQAIKWRCTVYVVTDKWPLCPVFWRYKPPTWRLAVHVFVVNLFSWWSHFSVRLSGCQVTLASPHTGVCCSRMNGLIDVSFGNCSALLTNTFTDTHRLKEVGPPTIWQQKSIPIY